jgi:rod shape-determining protein MreD
MFTSRIFITFGFFGTLFFIQEIVFNQIHFLIGGFSIFLAVTMTWVAMESRNGALISGFIAGFFLDLSPNIDSPFGQWTLVLTVMAYLVSVNREGLGDLASRPLTLSLIVAAAVTITLIAYLIASAILGEQLISFFPALQELTGNFIWTLMLAPLYMPITNKFHQFTLSSRDI